MREPITPADAGYDAIHAQWVANGRPAQFDMAGGWGGALYQVLNRKIDEPDFYRSFSMGPTTVNQETGKVTSKGWQLINRRYLRQRFKIDRKGQIRITRPELPDELD